MDMGARASGQVSRCGSNVGCALDTRAMPRHAAMLWSFLCRGARESQSHTEYIASRISRASLFPCGDFSPRAWRTTHVVGFYILFVAALVARRAPSEPGRWRRSTLRHEYAPTGSAHLSFAGLARRRQGSSVKFNIYNISMLINVQLTS